MGSNQALVFAADERFSLGLAVAVRSALTNLNMTFRPQIFVLTDEDFSKSSKRRIEQVVHASGRADDLTWLAVPGDELGPLNRHRRLKASAYARLLIPRLLPSEIRRVVYLDADVLVRKDLGPLFAADLMGAPFGAVRNFTWADDQSTGYFNTGVLLIDVGEWRETHLGERALEYALGSSEPLPLGDQTALNAVADDWCELNFTWNVQRGNLAAASNRPLNIGSRHHVYYSARILHFTGDAKPWKCWCSPLGALAWWRTFAGLGWFPPSLLTMWSLKWLWRSVLHIHSTVGTKVKPHARNFVGRVVGRIPPSLHRDDGGEAD